MSGSGHREMFIKKDEGEKRETKERIQKMCLVIAQVSQHYKGIQIQKQNILKLLYQSLDELAIISKTQSNFNSLKLYCFIEE